MDPKLLQIIIPLAIIVPLLYFRMRKMTKPQPLKWRGLWIRPAIIVGVAVAVMAGAPPSQADWMWLALAAAAGAAAGWQWGRTMVIEMHPENGTLMVTGGQAAVIVMALLILVRLGLRTGLAMEAQSWHLPAVLITDASIVFSAALFAMRSVEMFLRARRVMDAGRPS